MMIDQKRILHELDFREVDVFYSKQISEWFDVSPESTKEVLDGLVRNKFLLRLERGKYCRHTFRNEHVIGTFLAGDGVIAYWSALNLHGFTEQFPNTVFVQTSRQKRNITVLGVPYQFVKVKPEKIAGIETQGYGSNKFRITDKEKTIVDCFDLPQYGGEFPGIIRALVSNEWDEKKLIRYAHVVDNAAATKRMGYCAELFELPLTNFISYALSCVTRTISIFDINSPLQGNYDTRWGLRINLPKENILSMKDF